MISAPSSNPRRNAGATSSALPRSRSSDLSRRRSAAAADAAQALVDFLVVPSYLLQRLHRLVVVDRLRLALGLERRGLPFVAGFPFRLRLNEAALLHCRRSGT